jgi:hypothetical protein
MALKFNPFTGTLDQTGSGGGASYIDGEVQNFSALPETLGTPAVDSAYLVREAEGTWLLARKPAGIYIRTANTGARAADWTHASAFPDVFSDAAFTVFSDGDSTKNLQLSLSGITTGTVRTLTAPDASGTIQLTGHAAEHATGGSDALTPANIGAAPAVNVIELEADGTTTITTAQLPARGIAYADGGASFTVNLPTPDKRQSGLAFSIKTEHEGASGDVFVTVVHAAVNLLTSYELTEDEGSIDFVWDGYAWRYDAAYLLRSFPSRVLQLPAASGTIARTEDFAAPPAIGNTTPNSAAFTTLNATGTTELVNGGTTAGPFRIYNTFTDATNFERLNLRWASNVAIIGTEKGGTGGSARALEFQTDGVTRMTIASSGGTINVGSGAQFGSNGIQVASTASLRFSGGAIGGSSDLWMLRSGSGIIRFATGSSTSTAGFNRLQFGGTTSSFPALKRDTTTLQVRLADDSAFTAIQGKLTTETAYTAGAPTATGYLVLYDSAGTAYKVPAEAL